LVKNSFFSLLKKTKDVFLSDDEEGEGGKPADDPKKVNGDTLPKEKKKKKSRVEDDGPKKAPSINPEKQKQPSLLQLANNDGAQGACNTNVGKRLRSMKLAKSMGSVYKKINRDSNIHNDRHYLVAVAEQLKSPTPPKSPRLP